VTNSSTIVQRVWNYCNVLRDDGVSYGDYLEQLTYLLFLKMDDEGRAVGRPSAIPDGVNWQSLLPLGGDALEIQYRHVLITLGQGSGLIPVIFRKAQNKIQRPAKLRRPVELINGDTQTGLDIDVKGEIYEGLREKNAQDTKACAGQYFTPRTLARADLDEFVACYHAENRHERTPTWSESQADCRWRRTATTSGSRATRPASTCSGCATSR
jgi:type I restriction enzyme M protein